MADTRWWKYLQTLMGEQTQLEAAHFIGISKSNITRWKDGTRAAPDFVVKVARAYHANVLEALVEAEFITAEEAALKEIDRGGKKLADASDVELAEEMVRRLQRSESARRKGGQSSVGGSCS
ncbi:helix-turn-helix transcriptional regulator [Corynebacterium sp. TAE3-ERU12]|uniref:helix-turn-helix domain-containing protein n=1 Tax=Corynebacterium sp. TAE3-ERU12 TaxID=2849491 RepID=UPI001C46BEE2|nr:helix-turn-helix transcriptional regulator [Corynebacterium sp. TAE3-ERU12]MBV7294903.1 helix-turn-helix transcriptional regulator [Corynebacterium sp. TAE3-ERU12]